MIFSPTDYCLKTTDTRDTTDTTVTIDGTHTTDITDSRKRPESQQEASHHEEKECQYHFHTQRPLKNWSIDIQFYELNIVQYFVAP